MSAPATAPARPVAPAAAVVPTRRARLRDLFGHVAEQRGIVLVVVVLSVVSAGVALCQPLLVGEVIDRVGDGTPLGALPWVLAAFVLVGGVLGGVQQYLVQRTAEGVIRSSRRQLVGHILRLPVAEVDRRRVGDLVSRVSNDTTVVRNMLSQGFVESVAGVFTLVGAIVAMVLLDPLLLLVALVVSVLAVVVVVGVTQRIERASLGLQDAVGSLSAAVDRAVRALRTIRAANATEAEVERVGEETEKAWRVGLAVARVTALVAPVSSIAMQVTFLSVLGLGGLRVASGALSVAELVSFILFLFLLIMPLGQLFGTVSAIGEALGGLSRIHEVLDLEAEDDTAGDLAAASRVGALPRLELDGVSFSYRAEGDDAPRQVLDDVSFTVRPGQRVALVGPSGAGKSTVLSLLVRFFDPDSGAVRLDGVDLRDLPRRVVRARMGYVEQDAPVLAGTLRDNLTIAAPDADDDACRRALAAVNLEGVVDRSPLGLDAEVGEGGVLLSGGERQRLAVARAMLGRPGVLLLDESTSNLDGLNELQVREHIDTVAAGCTLLVVAHRLATVVDSDLILVVDSGRLVASGTHAELVRSSELYRRLAEHQLIA
ncbi:ABC transporter ATP-binding protein [Cellulosimicrobium sp. PMB13]|uniref:ABC transporter ATP-binding protein n=1 Tax=Cellulosimicrobium sp. PMB13 TaxID=3120158 RepID=UPI003F4B1793